MAEAVGNGGCGSGVLGRGGWRRSYWRKPWEREREEFDKLTGRDMVDVSPAWTLVFTSGLIVGRLCFAFLAFCFVDEMIAAYPDAKTIFD